MPSPISIGDSKLRLNTYIIDPRDKAKIGRHRAIIGSSMTPIPVGDSHMCFDGLGLFGSYTTDDPSRHWFEIVGVRHINLGDYIEQIRPGIKPYILVVTVFRGRYGRLSQPIITDSCNLYECYGHRISSPTITITPDDKVKILDAIKKSLVEI